MRVIKILLITIFSLIVLILMSWGAVVWFILTPEVVTPHIVNILQKHTKSEVSIKSVDLSLFERFPRVTLRIDSLRVAQTKDSIGDLLFAKRCRISVNPEALLDKVIAIDDISIDKASIYMYVDSLHGPLKTFILPEFGGDEDVEQTDSLDLSDYRLLLRRFKIDSAQITVDDRTKQFYTRVDNYSLDMSMNVAARQSDLDVVTGFSNLIVWREGDLLVKKTSLDLRSKVLLDRDSMMVSFDKARIKINNIDLKARGEIRRDTLNNGVQVDIRSSLNTPSIAEFLALIPTTIIDSKEKITTQGEVGFDIELKGLYSDDSMPLIDAKLRIDNAKAKYESRKLELERVDCDAYMFVDLNTPTNSYADIKTLHVNTSEIIDLTVSGKVTNAIEDPNVDLNVISEFDFDRFSEIFPLQEGVICKGTNTSDLHTQFKLSDLQNSRYADLYIDGESTFHNLEVVLDASKFIQDTTSLAYLYMQAERGTMTFGDNVLASTNSRTLRSTVNFSDLKYVSKTGEHIAIKDIELTLGANFDRGTSLINGVGVEGVAKNMSLGVDSLFNANLESSDIKLIIMPKNERHDATIDASISSKRIDASEPTYNSDIKLSSVDMDVVLVRDDEKQWTMDGTIGFSDFGMQSELFPLEVKIPNTSISVGDSTIRLNNAHLTLGESEIVATGYIHNLLRKLFADPRLSLSGELAINAPRFDFGELMEASNHTVLMMEDMTYTEEDEEDVEISEGVKEEEMMFLVPRRMDFVFDLNIDQAKIWDATVDNLESRVTIKDGVLSLERFKLNAIGAEAVGSVIYRNVNRESSHVAGDISLASVDINRIGELLPSINTMFPMLESFEGVVDFDFKANTNLTNESMIDMSTLYSAIRFKGRDLVLMDSDTFADLSKKMMFKNKDRNMVDSLEVFALVEESTIDVLPFSITIDRYSAIIGGSQVVDPETFDVDYSYNISIIKSPLPFKAGVDIVGNLEDFDFKITKAKLKKTDFDEQRVIYEEYRESIAASEDALAQELEERKKEMQAKRHQRRSNQEQLERETEAEIDAEAEVEAEIVADSIPDPNN